MGSPPTDVLMLNGVAALVRDLAEFAPVHELFQTYLKRWRKKNALIVAQRRKAKAQLATLWRDEPHVPDPDKEEHWPARRIYSPDRTKSELFPVPPELNRKLKKYNDQNPKELDGKLKEYNDPSRYHLLRSLDDKQDFSTTESFILLAELHDAAYSKRQLGYAEDYIVDVAEATKVLNDGISQVAVERLATLVGRVLKQIAAQVDPNARNKVGETLQEIIDHSRKELARLVIRVDQHFGTHSDRESDKDEVSKLRSDLIASNKELGRRLAKQIQIEAERQRQQQTETGGRGGKRRPPKKGAAHRPPDTDAKDDARIGDTWLTGRNSREFRAYGDLARKLGRGEPEIREAIDRDRKRRPDVWRAKRRTARRNKSVKRA